MVANGWASTGLEVLGASDFPSGRLNRPGTYVVCFGATWCPVTRRFMPKFVAERRVLPGTLAIADITAMDDPLWDLFRVRITPSIVVFQDGVERLRLDGRRFLGISGSALAKLERSLAASGPS